MKNNPFVELEFLREALEKDSQCLEPFDPLSAFDALSLPQERPNFQAGQLWRAVRQGKAGLSALVLLTEVSPVGLCGIWATSLLSLAGREEVLVDPEHSPTDRPLVLSTAQETALPANALQFCFGELSPDTFSAILLILAGKKQGGIQLRAKEVVEPAQIRWEVASLGQPERRYSFLSGPRWLPGDIREKTWQALRRATAWLGEDAVSLAQSDPWYQPFLQRLKKVFAELSPIFLPDPWPALSLGGAGLAAEMSRNSALYLEKHTETVSVFFGEIAVQLTFDLMPEQMALLCEAMQQAKPCRGVGISLCIGQQTPQTAKTDAKGFARIGPIPWQLTDPVVLQFSKGKERLVLRF